MLKYAAQNNNIFSCRNMELNKRTSNKQAKGTFRSTGMKSYAQIIGILLTSFWLAASCGDYGKVLKGSDYQAKRALALDLYQKEKYKRALPLWEELFGIIRGSNTAEETHWYLANTYFQVGDMLLANYYYSLFVKNFPKSTHREEALYMSAFSLYKASPRYTLDQTASLEAIQSFQNFVDMYPESARLTEANRLVDELLAKLERKMLNQAHLHYVRQEYRAAITTWETVLQDFPDTEKRFEVYFQIIKASYEFADLSIKQRKWERFSDVIDYYRTFADRLKGSPYASDAKTLMLKAEEQKALAPKPNDEDV